MLLKIVEPLRKFKLTLFHFWNSSINNHSISGAPIFVVGCGHSGTSLMLAMLDSHSHIYGVPKESAIAFLTDEQFIEEVKTFNYYTISFGKKRWAEKTPSHVIRIGRILELIPDAKIIVMVRDGRDVARSFQLRGRSLDYAIGRWNDHNTIALQYGDHPNVLYVKYEDLIESTEQKLKQIMSFLDESFETDQLQFHTKRRKWYANTISRSENTTEGAGHKQHRNWQINQPLFDGRKRYLDFNQDELKYVEMHTKPLLIKHGYLKENDLSD